MKPNNNTKQSDQWDQIFKTKDTKNVSWFEGKPTVSLSLIDCYIGTNDSIIDIGGGDSKLPDYLYVNGFENISVLDISKEAIEIAKFRLMHVETNIDWIVEDILNWKPSKKYDLLHDRATFHFLTSPDDQVIYKEKLVAGLKSGGHAIIATFSNNDGPSSCTGMNVARHDQQSIAELFEPEFSIVDSFEKIHVTPSGNSQNFSWNILQKQS